MESVNSLSDHDIMLLAAAYTRRASHLLEIVNKLDNTDNYSNKTASELDDIIISLNKVESRVNSLLDGVAIDMDPNVKSIDNTSGVKQISILDLANSNESTSINISNNTNGKRKFPQKENIDKSDQRPKKKNKDKEKSNETANNTIENEEIDTDDALTKGKRRWETRRMRLHDVDATNTVTKTKPKCNAPMKIITESVTGGIAKSMNATQKRLNISTALESTPKQTTSRSLPPKSPSRTPDADLYASRGSASTSLWSNKRGNKKEDSGQSVCPVTSWFCSVCTLENPMRARMCLACNSHRYYGVKNTNTNSSNTELASALLLDDIPGTPRRKNPSLMKSLYVNTEPKIGPDHQLSLDQLPTPSESDVYSHELELGSESEFWTTMWKPSQQKKQELHSMPMSLYLQNMQSKADEPEALRVLFNANYDVNVATDLFRKALHTRRTIEEWYCTATSCTSDSNSSGTDEFLSNSYSMTPKLNENSLLPLKSPFHYNATSSSSQTQSNSHKDVISSPKASRIGLSTTLANSASTPIPTTLHVGLQSPLNPSTSPAPRGVEDVTAYPLYDHFVRCMGMHWKDWNNMVRSLRDSEECRNNIPNKIGYFLSTVKITDLQLFYYGHFVRSAQYKDIKKETKKRYRKYAREKQMKYEKEQRALMKQQMIGNTGGSTTTITTGNSTNVNDSDTTSPSTGINVGVKEENVTTVSFGNEMNGIADVVETLPHPKDGELNDHADVVKTPPLSEDSEVDDLANVVKTPPRTQIVSSF